MTNINKTIEEEVKEFEKMSYWELPAHCTDVRGIVRGEDSAEYIALWVDMPKEVRRLLSSALTKQREEFVKDLEGMETSWCDGKHHENIGNVCPQDWRSIRNQLIDKWKQSHI